ncbi:MAG: excinuclease ABC subunit A [Desulforhopalus sp.]
MIKELCLGCAFILSFGTTLAVAADVKVEIPIQESLDKEKVKSELSGDIAFYWGRQPHPPIVRKIGSFKTSKRTNGLFKSRTDSCSWAMASALVALQSRAEREGGNAVINIVSNINNQEESSVTTYSCLAGAVMVNVALKGTVVTLKK